jgi:hypothetical protein
MGSAGSHGPRLLCRTSVFNILDLSASPKVVNSTGSSILAVVGEFTPQKQANTTNERSLPPLRDLFAKFTSGQK